MRLNKRHNSSEKVTQIKMKKLFFITVIFSFSSALFAQHEHHQQSPIKNETKKDSSGVINQEIEHENQKPGKIVIYHLYLTDTIVNYAGKSRHAIAANGQIPMPTLTFTEGDTAEVYVHNQKKTPATIHWHGVVLPNQFDGVPYLTQMPIEPGQTFLYRFPVVQNGTYWYHSH